ncbi:hypothetical protein PAMC26577_37795 [Caballeronia sordidicola]|uniref:Uncharacterized protein n=1 Tax=Caballeronia sordidicola TaxID=196367 RepID=A0A242M5H2_CABSO|nr:hypothetical protein PAMC26577_37795 [Caballeronia sordidicola]
MASEIQIEAVNGHNVNFTSIKRIQRTGWRVQWPDRRGEQWLSVIRQRAERSTRRLIS